MRTTLILLILGLSLTQVSYAEVYRWKDANGKTHYGDAPPQTGQAEKRHLTDKVEQNVDVPYESRRAGQFFPVTLYVSDDCKQVCDDARNYLKKRKIPFQERSVTKPEELVYLKQLTQTNTVPVLTVGKKISEGYSAGNWSQLLKQAGYVL